MQAKIRVQEHLVMQAELAARTQLAAEPQEQA
jgi:hypothetical protein